MAVVLVQMIDFIITYFLIKEYNFMYIDIIIIIIRY
jgi:hypothetical protein